MFSAMIDTRMNGCMIFQVTSSSLVLKSLPKSEFRNKYLRIVNMDKAIGVLFQWPCVLLYNLGKYCYSHINKGAIHQDGDFTHSLSQLLLSRTYFAINFSRTELLLTQKVRLYTRLL